MIFLREWVNPDWEAAWHPPRAGNLPAAAASRQHACLREAPEMARRCYGRRAPPGGAASIQIGFMLSQLRHPGHCQKSAWLENPQLPHW
jgi:hypothetical protein